MRMIAMATTLAAQLVLDALNMALVTRRPTGVIHHSDQGSQYTSIEFGHRCRDAGVRPSMGSVGDAYDNAMCESLNRQRSRSSHSSVAKLLQSAAPDEESRIMPVAGGGFDQCYNAQAVVAADSLLVVATDVVQAANDKQQLEPMVEKLKALPDELGQVETLLADNGYFSAANVTACEAANIVPLIATGREVHHPSLAERCAAVPSAPQDPTPVEAMAHRLKTTEGKKLYALRKQVPEPVFGIIKSVLGFRQFLLRGLDRVRGEWSLVTMAWNMKRMFALCPTA